MSIENAKKSNHDIEVASKTKMDLKNLIQCFSTQCKYDVVFKSDASEVWLDRNQIAWINHLSKEVYVEVRPNSSIDEEIVKVFHNRNCKMHIAIMQSENEFDEDLYYLKGYGRENFLAAASEARLKYLS